jgi:hypothetical protein
MKATVIKLYRYLFAYRLCKHIAQLVRERNAAQSDSDWHQLNTGVYKEKLRLAVKDHYEEKSRLEKRIRGLEIRNQYLETELKKRV